MSDDKKQGSGKPGAALLQVVMMYEIDMHLDPYLITLCMQHEAGLSERAHLVVHRNRHRGVCDLCIEEEENQTVLKVELDPSGELTTGELVSESIRHAELRDVTMYYLDVYSGSRRITLCEPHGELLNRKVRLSVLRDRHPGVCAMCGEDVA